MYIYEKFLTYPQGGYAQLVINTAVIQVVQHSNIHCTCILQLTFTVNYM